MEKLKKKNTLFQWFLHRLLSYGHLKALLVNAEMKAKPENSPKRTIQRPMTPKTTLELSRSTYIFHHLKCYHCDLNVFRISRVNRKPISRKPIRPWRHFSMQMTYRIQSSTLHTTFLSFSQLWYLTGRLHEIKLLCRRLAYRGSCFLKRNPTEAI